MSDREIPDGLRLKQDASHGDNLQPQAGSTVTANLVAQLERTIQERDYAVNDNKPLQDRIETLSAEKVELMRNIDKLNDQIRGNNMQIGRLKKKLGIE